MVTSRCEPVNEQASLAPGGLACVPSAGSRAPLQASSMACYNDSGAPWRPNTSQEPHIKEQRSSESKLVAVQLLRGCLEKRSGRSGNGRSCAAGADELALRALAAVRPLAPALAALLRRDGVSCLQHATAALWLLTADSDSTTSAALVAGGALPHLIALLSHKVRLPCTNPVTTDAVVEERYDLHARRRSPPHICGHTRIHRPGALLDALSGRPAKCLAECIDSGASPAASPAASLNNLVRVPRRTNTCAAALGLSADSPGQGRPRGRREAPVWCVQWRWIQRAWQWILCARTTKSGDAGHVWGIPLAEE